MNYLFLELDTTAPQLEIYAPSYTTRSSNTIINIQANETLSSYQEIYIIDSESVRHDLTFSLDDYLLTGNLRLNGLPIGIATIYVRLKDSVDNLSSLYSQSFYIMESEILDSEISFKFMDNKLLIKTMNHDTVVQTMKHETVVLT